MSSLAASRADGFYHPPDYDPAKHGSLNQFRGQHPLRERAKKLDQGILVIRFEMPFNVWCEGCRHLIGKGVRFNAEKKQIGNYHSTKIWSFVMRAPCCGQEIEVQTDPKNTEYLVVRGGQRKVETWTAESAETLELPDKNDDDAAAPPDDPFSKLERGESDKKKGRELSARISELYHDSNTKFLDDYALNKTLRRQNRVLRKQEKERDAKAKAMGLSDSIKLLPESEEDSLAASLVQFGDPKAFTQNWQKRRRAIKRQSIFTPSALSRPPRSLPATGETAPLVSQLPPRPPSTKRKLEPNQPLDSKRRKAATLETIVEGADEEIAKQQSPSSLAKISNGGTVPGIRFPINKRNGYNDDSNDRRKIKGGKGTLGSQRQATGNSFKRSVSEKAAAAVKRLKKVGSAFKFA